MWHPVGGFNSSRSAGGAAGADVLLLQAKGSILVPRSALVSDLKREACAELFLQEDTVDLYDFFGGQCYACLEDKLQTSVGNARLMDRQAVLLKGRSGKPPGPQALFLEAFSKPPDMLLVFDDGSSLAVHRWILELSSHILQDVLAHLPEPTRKPTHTISSQGSALTVHASGEGVKEIKDASNVASNQQEAGDVSGSSPTSTPGASAPPSSLQAGAAARISLIPSGPSPASHSPTMAAGVSHPQPQQQQHQPLTPSHQQQGAGECGSPHAGDMPGCNWASLVGRRVSGPSSPPTGITSLRPGPSTSSASGPAAGCEPGPGHIPGLVQHMHTGEAGKVPAAHGTGAGAGAVAVARVEAATSEGGLTQLRVPGDDRFSWTFVLQLLYPCCQMRRPPVTWHNLDRLLTLADKWCMTSVIRVCEDFLLLPTAQLSIMPEDPAYVWKWLVRADQLNMPSVIRKCISFVQAAKVSASCDRQHLEQTVSEVVSRTSIKTLTSLISTLITHKDELKAQVPVRS